MCIVALLIRDNPLNNFFHSAHSLLKDSGIYCVISLSFSCFILNGWLVLVFSCFIFCCYFFSFPDLYLTNIWSDFGHGHLFWFWFSTWFDLDESADLVGMLVLSYDYILIQKGVIFHFCIIHVHSLISVNNFLICRFKN